MADYIPADAPWPIEEVYPDELRNGDVVCIGGNYPWLQITRIVEAGPNQPEWEKPLGRRAFVLSPIDGDKPVTTTYDNHNERTVFRRRD